MASPHTSAGRVPTDKGYRFFVDTLLKLKPLHHGEIEEIERRLVVDAANGRSLVQTVSQMLSSVTRMAGLVTLPKPELHLAVADRVRLACLKIVRSRSW